MASAPVSTIPAPHEGGPWSGQKLAARVRSPWLLWPAGSAFLFGSVYLFAQVLKGLASIPGVANAMAATGVVLLDPVWKDVGEAVAAGGCVAFALTSSSLQWKALVRWDGALSSFAAHRIQAIVFVGLLPVIIRLALLPILGVPQPWVSDEFGYLLIGDTFASGRLTNPTHPFWKHFEAIYVFHQPTYTSKYPVAPAVLIAAAEIVGLDPWVGICVGAGLMCALICWMLQGWVPPKWAFIGGLLAVCRFTVTSSWVNSYWGGVPGAIGGALVVGALPRIMRHQRPRDSVLLGLGLAVLAQSRPYEGFLMAVPLMIMLGAWLLKQNGVPFRIRLRGVVLPLAAVLIIFGAWMAYYDWRVTGHPLLMPYSWHKQIYGTPVSFFWERPVLDAPGIHRNKDIADVFAWQLKHYTDGLPWHLEQERLGSFWQFYFQPLLTFPLFFLPLAWHRRRVRTVFWSAVLVLAGTALYPFFFQHYVAPLCGAFLLFVIEGMRRLHALKFRSRPSGAFVVRCLVLLAGASGVLTTLGGLFVPGAVTATNTVRGRALAQLERRGGKHLVLVQYNPEHLFHNGIVYNGADLDGAPVVWARSLDPASDKALEDYYADREVWSLNPDMPRPTLIPLRGKPHITVLAGAGGKRDDFEDGVSPGAIVVLLGRNFAREMRGSTNPQILGSLPVQLVDTTEDDGLVLQSIPNGSAPQPLGPLPLRAGNVSVQFGNTFAPILSVSNFAGQNALTIQVPFEVRPGWTSVKLQAGQWSAIQKIRVLPATPGIFQMLMSDFKPRAVLLRSDGSMVDLEHPAHRGEVLRLFSTGLGPLYPPVYTNERGLPQIVSRPESRLIIGVNHHGAPVIAARYAPSLVGVEQIDFEIPADVPTDKNVPLSVGVTVNGRAVYSNKSSLPIE